jgi:tetratricopeptide (TPR) repeat protein
MKKTHAILLIFFLAVITSSALNGNTFNKQMLEGLRLLGQQKYSEAIVKFTKAIQHNPENAEPYIYRGIAYMKRSEPFPAFEDIEKALTLDPENPENHIDAGIVYLQFEDYISARLCWVKAIRLDTEGNYSEQIRKCLLRLPEKMRLINQKNACENLIDLANILDHNLNEINLNVDKIKKMEADETLDSTGISKDIRNNMDQVIESAESFTKDVRPMLNKIIQDKEGLRKEWKGLQLKYAGQDIEKKYEQDIKMIRDPLEQMVRASRQFLMIFEMLEVNINKALLKKEQNAVEKKNKQSKDELADFDCSLSDSSYDQDNELDICGTNWHGGMGLDGTGTYLELKITDTEGELKMYYGATSAKGPAANYTARNISSDKDKKTFSFKATSGFFTYMFRGKFTDDSFNRITGSYYMGKKKLGTFVLER